VARTLGDVIGSFIPEAAAPAAERRRICIPVAAGDVLVAAIAWNLSVEISRAGAPCTLIVAPAEDDGGLWPPAGPGPLGSRLVRGRAGSLATSAAAAGLPASAVELECLSEGLRAETRAQPERWLLFSSPDPTQLRRVHDQILELAANTPKRPNRPDRPDKPEQPDRPEIRIGVTIHGVRRIAEAQAAFEELAVAVESVSDVALASYGLLVDDLHLYRAIVAQRPIGLAHPAAPATRALADVARLLLDDLEADTQ